MSIHFFCNTKRSSVNYLCYAISNAGYESIEECFYELAYNKISVHSVDVDLLFLKSVSFGKGDLCVH